MNSMAEMLDAQLPQLLSRGARSVDLQRCRRDGGLTGPGPQADLPGGHGPASAPLRWTPTCKEMVGLANRVFCIYNEPAGAKGRAKAEARTTGEQRMREAYSRGSPGRSRTVEFQKKQNTSPELSSSVRGWHPSFFRANSSCS